MNWPLYRSLHARGLTQAKLAALTGVNRSVLARILTNEHGRGKETRIKIVPYLSYKEVRALGWEKDAREWSRQVECGEKDAGESFKKMAVSSTANIVPSLPHVQTP